MGDSARQNLRPLRRRIMLPMTRHKHAHTGLVTPQLPQLLLIAVLRLLAMLVSSVSSTLQMTRRRLAAECHSDVTPTRRNHEQEYKRRIERGKARGLSRSQARGHARSSEAPLTEKPRSIDAEMELIRKEIASGESLTSAAKKLGVSKERARRYISAHGIARFDGKKWLITDERPRQVPIASNGAQKVVVVSPAEASKAASYANAAKAFVSTNDPAVLQGWRGKSVKDIRGNAPSRGMRKRGQKPSAIHA